MGRWDSMSEWSGLHLSTFIETSSPLERVITGGTLAPARAIRWKESVMNRLLIPLIFAACSAGFIAPAQAQSTANLVQASLLANVSVVKPGEPFTAGVLLKMKPGWHTYWSNPGDAGLPTRVQWILPPGFTASDLRFPVPTRIDEPGGIVVYGYPGQVLLTSTIVPPSQIDSAAVPITAKVNWLCCSENCVPGKATLNLQLGVAEKSVPDNTQLFETWQTRLPTPAPAPAAPLVLSDASPETKIRTTRKITDPKSIVPGAADGLILTVGTPRLTNLGTTIPISARVLKGQTVSAKSIPILLTWADPDGKDRLGEEITVPVASGH